MQIQDSVALVTGASSGIGEATAKLLSNHGAKVALVARSKEKLEKLSEELPDSFVVIADMSKEDEVRDMVKKVADHFGKVDILVNNAGLGYDAPIEHIDIKKLRYLIEVDLIGPVVAMQEVIPLMRKQKAGTIVNVSSGTALMALPTMAAYSSLKRALVGISLTGREELQHDGISVSVVYPFGTKTNFEKNSMKDNVPEGEWDGGDHGLDSAEFVAEKILEAITTGAPEVFAHDWMGKRQQ